MEKQSIHLVGPNRLQNLLLKGFLEEEIDLPCCVSGALSLESLADIGLPGGLPQLILFDCLGIDPPRIWHWLSLSDRWDVPIYALALFNVESGYPELEAEALSRNIQGILYNDGNLSLFTKGVLAMLQGELWFSRNCLSRYLLARDHFPPSASCSQNGNHGLTPREKEILYELVTGASNDFIATTLCISIHTVKTHIYKIYKKIKVSNRYQAMLWGRRFLIRLRDD